MRNLAKTVLAGFGIYFLSNVVSGVLREITEDARMRRLEEVAARRGESDTLVKQTIHTA